MHQCLEEFGRYSESKNHGGIQKLKLNNINTANIHIHPYTMNNYSSFQPSANSDPSHSEVP